MHQLSGLHALHHTWHIHQNSVSFSLLYFIRQVWDKLNSSIKSHITNYFHCVSSNVSSNCQPERMQNHIGYICLAFLHCVSSNVSSNGLRERMHSRIGCICLAFLHCVSSNVSFLSDPCAHGVRSLGSNVCPRPFV